MYFQKFGGVFYKVGDKLRQHSIDKMKHWGDPFASKVSVDEESSRVCYVCGQDIKAGERYVKVLFREPGTMKKIRGVPRAVHIVCSDEPEEESCKCHGMSDSEVDENQKTLVVIQ